ncbi:MAG: M56 family metallopeptidase [Ruminococcaceae bacterium]|nr:M56 family metallopeptidase [Oscillospiraceae bacterium]
MKGMFELLFSVTLSTNVFIIAILLLRFLFKNSSKNSRLFLWLLVGVKLILPFNIKSKFSLIPEGIVEKSTQSASGIVGDVVRSGTYENESLFDSKLIFLCIWVAVSLIILIYGAVSFWRLHKNIGDAIKMESNIFQSEKVVSPFVLGVIKPKIYIPFNLDDETLSHIVSHEKSHIKSFDNITKLVAFILLAVHWYNPLVWVCFKLVSQDIEFACDERVVKNYTLEKRKSYAEALLSCAVNEGRGLIHPLAFGEVSIKDRIKSVVSYKKTLKVVLVLFLSVAVVSFGFFATVPEVSAKEEVPEEPVQEETVTNETVTEETTTEVYIEETTTEPVTEQFTEVATEYQREVYADSQEEEPKMVDDLPEEYIYDENEETEIIEFEIFTIPDFTMQSPTQPYAVVTTRQHGPNIPTMPVISWDPMYP